MSGRRRNGWKRIGIVLSIVWAIGASLWSVGCEKKTEPEGYRVIAYDAKTHQWTILRNGTFDGKYLVKRLTAVCASYHWDDHEMVTGPEACDLQVGRMLVPNPLPEKRDEFLGIWEMQGETLAIIEGDRFAVARREP